MDNDDNDYHDEGLHLVGEESSKVSSVLLPYALPKFDFDEGHLRFDSLVENEVFLGIPSQEDNQWIEDFSRGSSRINFSSSAAESCSIPRHNNVWSEATSSESVEMLLKSVGQEEIVPGESIIRESDAGGGLPSLTKQMDNKIDDVKDSNSELLPVEFLGKFSGLNQNLAAEDAHGKCISQAQEVDLSSYGSSGDINEKSKIGMSEENMLLDMKSLDEKQVCTSVNESLSDKMLEDLSTSGVEVHDAQCLSQDVPPIVEKTNDHSVGSDVYYESADSSADYKIGHQSALDNVSVVDDKNPNKSSAETCATNLHSSIQVESKVETVEKFAAEVTMQEPSRFPPVGNSDLLTEKGHNEDVCSLETTQGNSSTVLSSSEGMEIKVQFESRRMLLETSSVANESGDGHIKECPLELSNRDTHIICSELMESDMKISHRQGGSADKKGENLGSTDQMDTGFSDIQMEAPISSGMQIESPEQGGHVIKHVDDLDLLKQRSTSVGDDCVVITERIEDGTESAGIHNEDSSAADHLSPPKRAGSADICKEVSSSEQGEVNECGQSVGICEKATEETASDLGKMEHDPFGSFDDGKMFGSSALGEVSKGNVETARGSECDVSGTNERESNFKVEGTDKVSHDTVKSVPSLHAAAGEVVIHNVGQKLHPFEEEREMQLEAPTDASMLPLQLSEDKPHQRPDSVAKKVASDVSPAEIVIEGTNQSADVVVVNTSDATTNTEHIVADKASVEVADKAEACSVHCDPNAKEEGSAKALDIQENEGPPREQIHVAVSSDLGGNVSAEIEKPNTISDSVVGGSDLSQREMNKQVGAKAHSGQNVPLSDSKEGVGGKASSNAVPSGLNVASEEDKSFTFDVSPLAGLPKGGNSMGSQSVPHIQAHKRSTVVDASPSTSVSRKKDPKAVEEISHGSQQILEKGRTSGSAKGPSERKTRRGSAKSGKENARKGNSVKEMVPLRHSEIGDRLSPSIGSSGTGQLVQLAVGSVERNGAKPGSVLSVSGSSLPDLNTSAPLAFLLQQPFTDLQQVQLRAQIFVYGSLIQGVAPDEACMVSAFGISDGGRSFWEPAWRACLERLHGQKSHPSSTETPVQSRSASDQANKQGTGQIKVPSTPSGRGSSKNTPSPVVNPMIPLSSPLWNISTPPCDALPTSNLVKGPVLDYQALSPLHAYQTPNIRNLAGHTTWPSQGPFPGSWVSSAPSPAVDAPFSALPVTETVKQTPIKESSVPISSTPKHAPPNPIGQSGSSSVFSGTSSQLDVRKVTVSHAKHSADPKFRKRKKTSVENLGQVAVPANLTGFVSYPVANSDASRKGHVEDLNQGLLVARSHMELASAPAVISHFSTSVAIATPSNLMFKNSLDKSLTAVYPVSSIDHTKGGDSPSAKRLLKPEDIAKVEEAKLQAEEAAAHAAVAVNNCQNVWSQLDKQNNTGLMSDVEAKLASAAVSIAAAASIAKAAAAAAKIASNVAVQAKLLVDEALISNGTQNPTPSELQSLPGFENNATPASILNVGDANKGSSSIIFAAREGARRKIEAASTASRHAENLEAIVKAAELAAEAVSQAGKVVAMGDPLPISKLVEAGPEGYWKGSKLPSGQGAKSNGTLGNKTKINNADEVADVIMEQTERTSDKEIHGTSPFPKETSRNSVEDHNKGEEGVSASVTSGEKDLRGQKNRRASDSSKTAGVVPDSEMTSRSTGYENMTGSLNESGIKESCLVEVFKDNGDFTGAWFSANVLSLKGGKALVCYTDLESDEVCGVGSGKLKEWVPLEAEGSKPPRIRLAHPVTSITFEGTRKRRRAVIRDYAWSLGDRVDAWIENGWREGVIIEMNKKDETTLSIHFPAQGKTSVVRAWHLRPTLVWKDGEWIEWSNFKESLQSDTPREKRPKLGSPVAEGKGKGKSSKNVDFAESGKSEEPKLLPLSANEKAFNIGSSRNENKPETLRTMRSGLQKEGSKVIFGVPKPGKKRKFMEVSKHYVSDRSIKNNAPNDSGKFAKYMVPQGTGTRGWKNTSKIDSKEKQAAESNNSKRLKSGKPPNLCNRTLPQKHNSLISSASVSKDTKLPDNMPKDLTGNNENDSGQPNLIEFVSSNIEEAAEEHISFSSQAPSSDAPRKAATSNAKSERLKKGKLAPAGGKSAKVEVKEKSISEAVEPRRSNRRIQPTSRLLEGLQSSLIISKIPSVSHDKNHRSHNRGVSKGNNN